MTWRRREEDGLLQQGPPRQPPPPLGLTHLLHQLLHILQASKKNSPSTCLSSTCPFPIKIQFSALVPPKTCIVCVEIILICCQFVTTSENFINFWKLLSLFIMHAFFWKREQVLFIIAMEFGLKRTYSLIVWHPTIISVERNAFVLCTVCSIHCTICSLGVHYVYAICALWMLKWW